MLPRLLPLVACLSVVLPMQAAPAPFRKAEPAQPEVELRGPLRQILVGTPSVIASQADWQAVAQAWCIACPPRVNFRTHFLFVHTAGAGYGRLGFALDREGDLHAVGGNDLGIDEKDSQVIGPRYFIKSFRRSDIKTVNGLPLPK